MDRVGHGNRIFTGKLTHAHELHHHLQTPQHGHLFELARLAQRTVVGHASPSQLKRQNQAQVVLSRQRSPFPGSDHEVGELGLKDADTEVGAGVCIQTIHFIEHGGQHIYLTQMPGRKSEDRQFALDVVDQDVRIDEEQPGDAEIHHLPDPGGGEGPHLLKGDSQDLGSAAEADLLALDGSADQPREPVAGEVHP